MQAARVGLAGQGRAAQDRAGCQGKPRRRGWPNRLGLAALRGGGRVAGEDGRVGRSRVEEARPKQLREKKKFG